MLSFELFPLKKLLSSCKCIGFLYVIEMLIGHGFWKTGLRSLSLWAYTRTHILCQLTPGPCGAAPSMLGVESYQDRAVIGSGPAFSSTVIQNLPAKQRPRPACGQIAVWHTFPVDVWLVQNKDKKSPPPAFSSLFGEISSRGAIKRALALVSWSGRARRFNDRRILHILWVNSGLRGKASLFITDQVGRSHLMQFIFLYIFLSKSDEGKQWGEEQSKWCLITGRQILSGWVLLVMPTGKLTSRTGCLDQPWLAGALQFISSKTKAYADRSGSKRNRGTGFPLKRIGH